MAVLIRNIFKYITTLSKTWKREPHLLFSFESFLHFVNVKEIAMNIRLLTHIFIRYKLNRIKVLIKLNFGWLVHFKYIFSIGLAFPDKIK